MKLMLTVGYKGEQKGIISLWDKEIELEDEIYLELELTKEQIEQLTFNNTIKLINVIEN